jgi:hypothetical protein
VSTKSCNDCTWNGYCSAQQRHPYDSGPDQPYCDGYRRDEGETAKVAALLHKQVGGFVGALFRSMQKESAYCVGCARKFATQGHRSDCTMEVWRGRFYGQLEELPQAHVAEFQRWAQEHLKLAESTR